MAWGSASEEPSSHLAVGERRSVEINREITKSKVSEKACLERDRRKRKVKFWVVEKSGQTYKTHG